MIPKPALPKRRDWQWLAALALIGCLLGLVVNAVNPRGINLRIALGLNAEDRP